MARQPLRQRHDVGLGAVVHRRYLRHQLYIKPGVLKHGFHFRLQRLRDVGFEFRNQLLGIVARQVAKLKIEAAFMRHDVQRRDTDFLVVAKGEMQR